MKYNKDTLFTVIVNCYNSSSTVDKTIRSLIKQDYASFEVIIIDNNSNDETLTVIENIVSGDLRFKIYSLEKHMSLSLARNYALSHVNGTFFCFLDSDDIYSEHRISNVMANINSMEDQDVFITNGYEDRNSNLKEFYKTKPELNDLLLNYKVYLCAVVFSHRIKEKLNFSDQFNLVEEYYAIVRLVKLYAVSVSYLNVFDVYWTVHSNSLTWRQLDGWSDEYLLMDSKLKEEGLLSEKEHSYLVKKAFIFSLFKNRKNYSKVDDVYKSMPLNLKILKFFRGVLGLQLYTFVYVNYRRFR